jgi:hypothetical protein
MSAQDSDWSEFRPLKRGFSKFIESTICAALGGTHYRDRISQSIHPIKDPAVQALSTRYFSALSFINTVDDELDKWKVSLPRAAEGLSTSARAWADHFGDDPPSEVTAFSQLAANIPALLTATVDVDLIPYVTNLLEGLKTDLLALDGLRTEAIRLEFKLENGKGDAAEAAAARTAFQERLDAYMVTFEEKRRALARKVWDSKNSIVETLFPDGGGAMEPIPVQLDFRAIDGILREAKPTDSPRPSLDREEDGAKDQQP